MTDAYKQRTESRLSDYDGGETKGHAPSKTKLPQPGLDVSSFTNLVKSNLQNVLPALMAAERGINQGVRFAQPYVTKGVQLYTETYKKLEPYGVDEIGTCITGFAMMFFGGFFITTVAVYEAIVQGGLENFKLQCRLIYDEFLRFKEANEADDTEDLDKDGIADVNQISSEKYTVRKVLVALRAIEPDVVSQSLHSLYTIFIAVAATLRLQFARTISLGGSLGDQMEQIAIKLVHPQVKNMVSEPYQKWIEPTSMYLTRFLGVMIAFQIQRILSTFHTAVKGARVFTKGLTDLAQRNRYGHLTEGYADEILSGALAVAGIYLQLFMWTEMPIIVKLAFFPAFFVEGILSFFVNATLMYTSGPVA